MSKSLSTNEARVVFESMKVIARKAMLALNERCLSECYRTVDEMREVIVVAKRTERAPEELLNDFYVLDKYTNFLSAYADLWNSILNQKFSSSWDSLQDALDLLRLVKRFSQIDIEFFETQLIELEKIYPYNVFFSIGATVERFDCSICGVDIDTEECPHMRGHLYGGVMVHAIVQKIVEMDHVSIVLHPEDKRCVVRYDDTGEQFKLVRYLSELITSGKLQILNFGLLKFSKRRQPNPEYRKIGRNEPCFCGSGKKFKNCCVSMEYVEGDHVDILALPRCIEDAVA